jgi:DNA-binding winged helix-turn-helix (wHTH) protein
MQSGKVDTGDATEFRFGGYTLDLRQGRLWGATGEVQLRPKTFALLGYMVRHPGRVLSKEELLDAVWPDLTVTEDSLSQCIHALRTGLGEVGPRLVRTVPRRGYLFDCAVPARVAAVAVAAHEARPDLTRPAARHSSIAVMPFSTGPAVSPEDRLWFDGVVNDVISQLARMRSFDVIARGSTFAVRELASDPVRAGQSLGADYVLSGSVAPHRAGFRLHIDLVRSDLGTILWTDEVLFERPGLLELVGALVDRITRSVLTEINASERDRARLVPDQSLTAWQAFHRGMDAFFIYEEQSMMQARAYLVRATELDPGFVRAFAALSECQSTIARTLFCTDKKAEGAAARRSAEVAMRLDESAPSAQFAYAHAQWLHGARESALFHAGQSVSLSPGFAEGFAEIGFYHALYGDPDLAIGSLARSELLNPISPFIDSVHVDRAMAHLQLNRPDDAALWAMKAIDRRESYPQMQITGAIILAATGHLDRAKSIVETLRAENAHYDPMKVFKPPFSVAGPARDLLLRAVGDLGFD